MVIDGEKDCPREGLSSSRHQRRYSIVVVVLPLLLLWTMYSCGTIEVTCSF
jgi:hypothetical protein